MNGSSTRPDDKEQRPSMQIMIMPSPPPPQSSSSLPPPPPPTLERGDGDGQAAADISNPDRVRNLNDLLKYSTKMISEKVDTQSSDKHCSLTQEKQKFLTNVLSSMSVNVQEEMNNSINILMDSKKDLEEYEYAFDVIDQYVDNIDYANDFLKLGGIQVFIPGLKSEHASVRTKTAELIAVLVQNNPYCQDKFNEHSDCINLLMSLVEKDIVEDVRVKALHAISCLIRQNETVFSNFIEIGGKDLILYALKSSSNKLKIKAVFIINASCHMGNEIASMYVHNGVVQLICSIIMNMEKTFETYHHNLFLSTLNQLIQMTSTQIKDICSSDELKTALISLRDSYPNDSDYQDEKDQILWLMETLTVNT